MGSTLGITNKNDEKYKFISHDTPPCDRKDSIISTNEISSNIDSEKNLSYIHDSSDSFHDSYSVMNEKIYKNLEKCLTPLNSNDLGTKKKNENDNSNFNNKENNDDESIVQSHNGKWNYECPIDTEDFIINFIPGIHNEYGKITD
ncbi:hypothetical protein PIROE2DRAFT_2568 [Piromyces sp. E2]|nr:hypothetical protein PIROE2DRAFT_2568 [Piromyces sp. E2]|eukprot:OUM69479.1 hypothetical protein PIROE2DRAFT_2568 [Piromyces sp. E2]